MFDIASFFNKKIEQAGGAEVAVTGGFSINTTVAPATNYVEEIEIGGGYGAGMIQLYVPNTAGGSYKRYGATIMCGTTLNDAISQSHVRYNVGVGCGCFINTVTSFYYFYDNDSLLSGNFFGASVGTIRISSAVIDGTKLKITFRNNHGTITTDLKIDGRYTAWRT